MSDETPKLLPCPFCGGCKVALTQTADPLWVAQCLVPDCNAEQWSHDREKVVSYWNRRTTPGTTVSSGALTGGNVQTGAESASNE
jgi:hypothetical protein